MAEERWRSADKLGETLLCLTPGCKGEAQAKTGRRAFCLECRVRRGTAWPDGTVRNGGGGRRDKAHQQRQADGRFAPSPTTTPEPAGTSANGVGIYERRALELVSAARTVDAALAVYGSAKLALDEALKAFGEARERLPTSAA